MRKILLYFINIIFPLCFFHCKSNAQWDKMPIGTTLVYKCNYRAVKIDDRTGELDTVEKRKNSATIKIDTIINLPSHKTIVLFDKIFDPYSYDFGDTKEHFYNEVMYFPLSDKNKCSMFFFSGDAIYGISVDKTLKSKLNNIPTINALNDSLTNIIQPLASQFKYSIRSDVDQLRVFDIQGSQAQLQFFKVIKNSSKSEILKNYDKKEYTAYYLPSNLISNSKSVIYKFSQGHFSSFISLSSIKGIIRSYAEGYRGSRGIIIEMKLDTIEYPTTSKIGKKHHN